MTEATKGAEKTAIRRLMVVPMGGVLKALRQARGWRQGEAERRAGLPAGYLTLYEGGRPLHLDDALRLADVFDVALRDIITPASADDLEMAACALVDRLAMPVRYRVALAAQPTLPLLPLVEEQHGV